VADRSGVQAWPERSLLYYPSVPAMREGPADLLPRGETLEYANRDYERAIALLRRLSTSRERGSEGRRGAPPARNLRKAGRAESALKVYSDLAREGDASLSGVPADLVARRARCALLEELGRPEELRSEAETLAEGLRDGRWQLDFARRGATTPGRQNNGWAKMWTTTPSGRRWLKRSAGFGSAGRQPGKRPGVDGSRLIDVHGLPVTVLWRASPGRLASLVASARYQRQHWFEPALDALDGPASGIALLDEQGRVVHGAALPARARKRGESPRRRPA